MANIKILMQIFSLLKEIVFSKSKGNMTGLHPKVRDMAEEVISRMFNRGYAVMVYQGFRSFEEQDYLYAQGRTRWGQKVTNARGGESFHNYGVAVDLVFLDNGRPSWASYHPWELLGTVGKEVGFEWGGDWTTFVDRPHFQYTKGYNIKDFQSGKVDYKKLT